GLHETGLLHGHLVSEGRERRRGRIGGLRDRRSGVLARAHLTHLGGREHRVMDASRNGEGQHGGQDELLHAGKSQLARECRNQGERIAAPRGPSVIVKAPFASTGTSGPPRRSFSVWFFMRPSVSGSVAVNVRCAGTFETATSVSFPRAKTNTSSVA